MNSNLHMQGIKVPKKKEKIKRFLVESGIVSMFGNCFMNSTIHKQLQGSRKDLHARKEDSKYEGE